MSRCHRFVLGLGFAMMALALCVSATAQDPNRAPTYGALSLQSGFTPDPIRVNLEAGGSIRTTLGGVSAYVAAAPDFRVHYRAGGLPLTFWVQSAADTTLLINLPNGVWVANDDSANSLNPVLRFAHPLSGRYDIFVGTVGPRPAPATLYITELR